MAFHAPPESKFLTPSMDKYIEKYEKASSCKQPRDLYLDKPARISRFMDGLQTCCISG